MTPFISVIIATARSSRGALVDLESEHLLERTLKSLEAQTFKDFELVVADSLFPSRDLMSEIQDLGTWSFPITVTPVKSWWLAQGMWAMQAGMNAGIRASSGQHLMCCGDCCEFPPHVLGRCAEVIAEGYQPHCLYAYKHGNKMRRQKDGGPSSEFENWQEADAAGRFDTEEFVRDSRWRYVPREGHLRSPKCAWEFFFGYGVVSREDYEHINGWSEHFDGDKPLGDCEVGSRLEMAGRFKMHLDRSLWVTEYQHHGVQLSPTYGSVVKNNLDLVYLMRYHRMYRANDQRLSEEDCKKVIHGEIVAQLGWPKPPLDDSSPAWKYQKHWIEHQPCFRLFG